VRPPAPSALEADLAVIRERGWALDNEEYGRGLLCLAAAIRDHSGTVVGTVGISVTVLSHTLEDLVHGIGPRVIAATQAISRSMGGNEEHGG